MTFFRTWLEKRRILSSEQLLGCPNKQTVRVAGLVVVHQAKGHHFITLEDEYGLINVIIRPKVYEAYERVLHDSRLLIVEGRAQQEEGATSLLARRIFVLKN
jgi:error-prone DNA polymerase